MQEIDRRMMRLALALAAKGRGRVHPNPMVGAVLARGGKVLAQGWHERFGGPHAEVRALKALPRVPAGATLYTTLEPCCHFGKTPPCTDLLIEKGVRRLVSAAKDPDPKVCGKGFARLKKAGVRVSSGVLEKEARELNKDFAFWVRTGRPYVTVKVAQTLDGNIATASGESKWITGPKARKFSHKLRAQADAVLVGVNTVLKDDPRLNARIPGVKVQPMKVVLDALLRTPPRSKLLRSGTTLIFTTSKADKRKKAALQKKAQIVVVREKKAGRVDLGQVMRILGKRGIVNLLIEGGGEAIAGALKAGVVNEAYVFVAPIILGGRDSVRSVSGEGAGRLSRAWKFRRSEFSKVGQDLLIHGIF